MTDKRLAPFPPSSRRLQPLRGSTKRGPGPLSSTHRQRSAKRGSLLHLNTGEDAGERGARKKRDSIFLKRDTLFLSNGELSQGELASQDEEVTTRDAMKHQLEFFWDIGAGWDLLVIFLGSLLQTLLVTQTAQGQFLGPMLSKSKVSISTLGAFYSFALVFRTNICYSRWWEGRSMWGSICINSIRLVQQGRLYVKGEELQDRLSCMVIAFAYACKAHLRGNSLGDEEEEGAGLVERGVLAQGELDVITVQNGWQPAYCIDAIRSTINEGLLRDSHEWRSNASLNAFEVTIGDLISAVGACVKVQSTGLPFAYDDILKTIGNIFFFFASLAWAADLQFYNPFIVLTIYMVAKMITAVGNDLEDPFGLDYCDLPLGEFCATVERQVNSVQERGRLIKYDLAFGPATSRGARGNHYEEFIEENIELGLGGENAVETEHTASTSSGPSEASSSSSLLAYQTFDN